MPKKYLAKIGEKDDKVFKGTVIIPISIGQPYHQGEKLKAIFELHNQRIKSSKFVLADTIHHFTYQLEGLSKEEAYAKADAEGKKWRDSHDKTLKQYQDQIEVSHWSEWINHADFARFKKIIDDCKDPRFIKAVERAATSFTVTFYDHIKIDTAKADELCVAYVKEEAAVILLWSHLGFHDMLYPRTQNNCNRLIFDSIQIIYSQVCGPDKQLTLHDINFDLKHTPKNTTAPMQNGGYHNNGFFAGNNQGAQGKKLPFPSSSLAAELDSKAANDHEQDGSDSGNSEEESDSSLKRGERSLKTSPMGSPTGSPPRKTLALDHLEMITRGFYDAMKGNKEKLSVDDLEAMAEFTFRLMKKVEREASVEESQRRPSVKQQISPQQWRDSPIIAAADATTNRKGASQLSSLVMNGHRKSPNQQEEFTAAPPKAAP